ncbi:RNA polymerase sigma factor [uncultured Polaribacter sp.]|uniref:RNA polymerase sigma factor n=1 Tax=uncultured Polaribacter sp. TaxID=174711 RepID=UPI002628DB9B|nr:RNA polymerase sigma-70 factor [uncultured Polaribacter sp.]
MSKNSLLISRLQNGDEEAYASLVDAYHHKLCVYASNLINDGLSAEDIVQTVFINLWKRRKKLTIKVSLESFLYKAVYYEFINQYRKKMTALKVEKRYYHHLEAVIEDYDEAKIENAMKMVFATIQYLPPRCKEVFILSKKNGLSNIEIAEHLNISIKTVESQISKAFKVLREKLDKKISPFLFLLFSPGYPVALISKSSPN